MTLPTIDAAFDAVILRTRAIFARKLADYGPTWLLFRPTSLLDQIWIKLKRLRTLEETENLVGDTPEDEYFGIINYCLIGLLRDDPALPDTDTCVDDTERLRLPQETVLRAYDAATARARALLIQKNHDYGSAWQSMAVSSITDQMLIKIMRTRHLLEEQRRVPDPDSWQAQLCDTLNYCLFSLLLRGFAV